MLQRLSPAKNRPSRLALLVAVALSTALSAASAHAALTPCVGPLELSGSSGGGKASVEWKGRRCGGRLELGGEVHWDDEMRLVQLGPGAFVRGEETVGRSERRLSARPGDGGKPTVAWWIDDEEASFDADARAWLSEHLLLMLRQTGFAAERQVEGLLDSGGTAALISELEAIDNDRVEALYVETALGDDGLNGEDEARLLAAAARLVASDAELADLLVVAAGRPGAGLEAVATAARAVGSDGDRCRALAAGLAAADGTPARVALLRSAAGVASDGDLARLLIASLGRLDFASVDEREAFAAAVATLGSDGDRARVLAAAAERGDLAPPALNMVLESAAGIGSDGDLSRLLVDVARRYPLAGELRQAYLRTASGIGSEADRRRAEDAL